MTLFVSGLVYLSLLIAMIYLANRFTFISCEQEKDKIVKIKYAMMEKSYLGLEQSVQNSNKLLHEMKNHLLVILDYARRGERDSLIKKVEELAHMSSPLELTVHTGSDIVDLVLQDKILQGRSHNINMQFEIQNLAGTPVSEMDMCSILSNLLDNAIEACSFIEQVQKPFIQTKIKRQKNFLAIKIVNSADSAHTRCISDHTTTKSDKETHGFGLQVVQGCVDKYSGNMRFAYDGHVFSVSILLSLSCID